MREFELPPGRASEPPAAERSKPAPTPAAENLLRPQATAGNDDPGPLRHHGRHPEDGAHRMTALPEHPGEITWVDGSTGEVLRVDPASEFPESIRYATDEDGVLHPIVRLDVTGTDNHREIAQITEDGRVLRRTYQSR